MAKLLFGGDLHDRATDKTTIAGYVQCVRVVRRSLVNLIQTKGYTHFLSIGDWYDKGFGGDTAAAHAEVDADIEMSKVLNGNFYGLIGNHIRLSMDSNPEFMLIQPHPYYKSRRSVTRDYQIIKTPNTLRIGDVQISFMHYNKDAEDCTSYKPVRQQWAKYHIALFHTMSVIPHSQLARAGLNYHTSTNTKIGQVLDGVDLAIVGDCHTPLGQFDITTERGRTIMIVPGSLTNTDSSLATRHNVIMLPAVTIDEETSQVTLAYERFDLHTNLLTFQQKNAEIVSEKLSSLRGKQLSKLHEDVNSEVPFDSSQYNGGLVTLNTFMKLQEYSEMDKALFKSVLNEPENIANLIKIYEEANKIVSNDL